MIDDTTTRARVIGTPLPDTSPDARPGARKVPTEPARLRASIAAPLTH